VLPAEKAQYSAIIDSILACSDLNTVTPKQIRRGLQEKVDVDISDKKACHTSAVLLQLHLL
jgi:hypothetical protein